MAEVRACVLAVKGAAINDEVDWRLLLLDGVDVSNLCGDAEPDEEYGVVAAVLVVVGRVDWELRRVEAGEGHGEVEAREARTRSKKSSDEADEDEEENEELPSPFTV